MQFVDKALARRFEAVEEMPQVLYARAFQKMRPEIGAAEEEICGGHMIFAGLGSPIGRATGAGLDRPFGGEDLDRVEQFYRTHHAPAQLDLCPLHDAAEVSRAGIPTVMLFVQSLYGISHNKIENTREEHLIAGITAFDKLASKTVAWIQEQ